MNRRSILAATALVFLAACASTVTAPVDASGEGTPVYFISTQEADSIMKKAMVEVFPKLPIMKVEAPYSGYTASMDFLLDSHSVTLAAIPAKGQIDGMLRDGYSFQVSQYGSIPITGSIKARNLIEEIERMTATAPQGDQQSQ